MRRVIAILLVLVLVGIIYTNITRSRRFSAPSAYDYPIKDSLDLYYYNASVVQLYIQSAQSLGPLARSLWTQHRIDVRFPDEADPEEEQMSRGYWSTRAHVILMEKRLQQSWRWKQEGFSNADIQRLEETGISALALEFENTYGPLLGLPWNAGSQGEHVRLVQEYLVAKGFDIPIDGTYGSQTSEAVKEIQRRSGSLVTGVPTLTTLQVILEP